MQTCKTQAFKRQRILYSMEAAESFADDVFDYTAPCPVCGRRVFDFSGLPPNPLHLRLKCPHCRQIIHIPLISR